jgi:hypothetical protein
MASAVPQVPPQHLGFSPEVTTMSTSEIRTAGITLLVILLFVCFWYIEAGNFSYSNIPGTYTCREGGNRITLELKPDRTFSEEITNGPHERASTGTWYLFPSDSQGHIHFSDDLFGVTPRSVPNMEDSHAVYGTLTNWFGFRSFTLDTSPTPLAFRRKLFS